MQKTIKNLMLCSIVTVAPMAAGVAFADGGHFNNPAYVVDSQGSYVRDSQGQCVRTSEWTPERASATPECGGEAKTPAEPANGPAPAAIPKTTFQAETLFDFDKSKLKNSGKDAINDLVTKLKDHPEVEVVTDTGYTDRIGSESYNQRLSERRAATVKSYMVSKGIDANRIEAVGKGKADPVVDCADVKGRATRRNRALVTCLAPNRRVEVVVTVQAEKQP